MKNLYIYLLIIGFAFVWNLYRSGNKKTTPIKTTTVMEEFVQFNLKELSSTKSDQGETKIWLATYDKNNKTAKFKLELLLNKPTNKEGMSFTNGVFYGVKNSDNSELLSDIARVLEAKKIPTNVEKVNSLSFTATILGTNLSIGTGKEVRAGYFTSDKKGSWTATKVFIGEDQAEFFLNIDLQNNIGFISIKDPDYGDKVIAELAKVL